MQRRGIVSRRQPDADVGAGPQRVALGLPQLEGDDRRRPDGHIGKRDRVAQQRETILDDRAVPNERRHRRAP